MKNLLPVLSCIILFATCKKKEEPAPEAPAPVVQTIGPVSGTVSHYNEFGDRYTAGLANTTVSIEGGNIQAITNENGRYTLKDVSAGTYTLSFNKPNTGLIKVYNVVYKIGDTISHNAEVADKPTFTISTVHVKDTSWFAPPVTPIPGFYYKAVTTVTNSKASTVAIIGKTAALDLANNASYENYAQLSPVNKTNDYNRFISYAFLRDTYGFKKDDVIYVKIYPVSTLASSYIDPKQSRPVYTAFGAPYPTTFTLTMP